MEIKIEISCCMCKADHETKIELPEGWAMRYDTIYEEHGGFCPDHKQIAEFAEAQCPGCVGGWGDCSLWESFAYSNRRTLTEDDFKIMRTGVCPKRTNGTFGLNNGIIEKINLSEIAENESGIVLEKAIKKYWERYPES